MDLEKKTVIITGARRIGKAVALALAENGCNIVLTYNKSKGEIEELAEACKGIAIKANVTKREEVKALFEKTRKEFEKIDIVINMASHFEKKRISELTEEDFENSMVDIKGTYLCCLEAIKHMEKGHIINFSDDALDDPYEGYIPYMAAKGGVEALTKAMAKETPHIQINCIAPGYILAPKHIKGKLKETGSPEDVTKAVISLLESNVTGKIIKVC